MTELVWHTDPGKGWTFDLLARSLETLGIEPRGVLHIGAHLGEEIPYYLSAGFGAIHVVEPDPESVAKILAAYPYADGPGDGLVVTRAACGRIRRRATFNRNQLAFFSGLVPRRRGKARTVDTFEVDVMPAHDLQRGENVVVIDTQGTEIDVLLSVDLAPVELVIIECWEWSNRPGAECAAPLHMADKHMLRAGFRRAIRWVYDNSGYFDVLYVRRKDGQD